MSKCIIIGSGLGGLSAGILLARKGYEVTILEQATRVGGCMQCFSRDGMQFETGMHVVGSLDEGQILSNYLELLGVKDKLQFSRLDTCAYDIVSLQGERFAFANGREAMMEQLLEKFPTQRDNLMTYWRYVESVAMASPLYKVAKGEVNETPQSYELFMRSLDEVMDEVIADPLLRNVLVGNMPLYAARRGATPFSTHAFVADFYNKSAFRIVGGGERMAKALQEVLESLGGKVLLNQRATKIETEGGKAKSVTTQTGDRYECDLLFSDIHPSQLLTLLDDNVVRPSYRTRINSIGNSTSAFSLYLKFKPQSVPYLNSNYFGYVCASPWDMLPNDAEPQGYLYMHHCHELNQRFAQTGVVMVYMSMDEVSKWSDTTVCRRGVDYEAFKDYKARQVLALLERDFPGIGNNIESYYTATPLTYRDYTLTPEGSIYGMAKDVTLGVSGRVSYKTKISNLLLVGQNINAHGVLGVLVGSLNAVESVPPVGVVGSSPITSSTLIVGGGLGGLMTGALLAKEGHKVTVLEKNATIGGGLECFRRKDADYATGMHIFGGMGEGGTLRRICTYLGIMDSLKIKYSDALAFDSVRILKEDQEYLLPQGREAYVDYLSQRFPHEKEGIKGFVDELYRISQEVDLYYLRPSGRSIFDHSDRFFMPIDKLVAEYVKDPELQSLLVYLNPLYAGVKGHTPAYIHALINLLYINCSSQFEGNSQQLADGLKKVIELAGGQVLANEEVTSILSEDKLIVGVETRKGHLFHADNYVSAVHPFVLLRIAGKGVFTPSFRKRMEMAPDSASGFSVFVRFKDGTFPYLNRANYCVRDYESIWHQADCDFESWPCGLMYITPPEQNQGPWAKTMIINCMMNYEWTRRWEDSSVGKRGESYSQWKQDCINRVLDFMEEVRPGFREAIDEVFGSSPLTIRDYYGNRNGSLYGLMKDSENMALSQLSVVTKVKNLFLTGQSINLHGLCGVTMTAVETAEAIVGRNHIVEKLNK